MPFKTEFGDITECRVSAIINSLGIRGDVYGKLCKSILKAANDSSLTSFIDSQVNEVGTVLVTKAGCLPTKHIIHVVTPFKKDDDSKNTKLIEAYDAILSKAIELGLDSIAVCLIGTGANGYSENQSYRAAMEAISKILEREEKEDRDILDITMIVYLKKFSEAKLRAVEERAYKTYRIKEYSDYCLKSTNEMIGKPRGNKYTDMIIDIANDMADIDEDEMFVPAGKYLFPFDFIDDYMNQKGLKNKVLSKNGLDHKRKYNLRNKVSLSKLDVYRLAFMCKMNKSETIQFMIVNGSCFSPLDKMDIFYREYLNGKYGKIDTLYELTKYSYNYYGIIFSFCEK